MKLTQCERYKNHYYDGDKYNACPHCAKLGLTSSERKKRVLDMFKRPEEPEALRPAPSSDGSEKTVMLTNVLDPQVLSESEGTAASVGGVGVSGSISDIKTVAMYGFEEDSEPVVGWLTAVTGNDKGSSYELKSGKNTIGRNGSGAEVDVSIDGDHSISRGAQAVLIYEPKKRQFLIQNANGPSLVYLNDELLLDHKFISSYDKITIGETDMLFVALCGEKFSW